MKIAQTLEAQSPAGGSIRCEIASGGQRVRIVSTYKGIEQVVELGADTIAELRQGMFDVFIQDK